MRLVVPGAAVDDRLAQAFVDAASLAGITLERMQPATENSLRQRLAGKRPVSAPSPGG